jgi:hypothetical protein
MVKIKSVKGVFMVDFLPLGSIVILENGEKKIMIYGRKQIATANGERFDYVACLYPEGNIGDEYTYLFNHSDIREVVFRGYVDSENDEFLKYLETVK